MSSCRGHRPPAEVWHGHTAVGTGSGDQFDDLAAVIRRYTRLPGARLMTRGQVPEPQRLTPLERALSPASRRQSTRRRP